MLVAEAEVQMIMVTVSWRLYLAGPRRSCLGAAAPHKAEISCGNPLATVGQPWVCLSLSLSLHFMCISSLAIVITSY